MLMDINQEKRVFYWLERMANTLDDMAKTLDSMVSLIEKMKQDTKMNRENKNECVVNGK